MARPLRVQFRGAIYHVMSRGIERRPIVRDDSDRTRWMERLRRTVETYGWRGQCHPAVPSWTPKANSVGGGLREP